MLVAACLALQPVTVRAAEETRYLWQASDEIYWSTTMPTDLESSEGGTALATIKPDEIKASDNTCYQLD